MPKAMRVIMAWLAVPRIKIDLNDSGCALFCSSSFLHVAQKLHSIQVAVFNTHYNLYKHLI